jgi:hypothetical protein
VKATGPRDERETIIRMDESDDNAVIWTASEVTYRRMLKRGWKPVDDGERHAEFIVPKTSIRLPRPKSGKKRTGFAITKAS